MWGHGLKKVFRDLVYKNIITEMRSFQMKKMYLLSITLISLGILAGCSNNDSTKVQKLETTISSLKKENDSLKTGNTDENKKSQESKVDSKQKKEEKNMV